MRARNLLFVLLFFFNTSLFAADSEFAKMEQDFLHEMLLLSPVTASYVGFHVYKDPKTGKEIKLDEQLDDMSAAGLQKQRAVLQGWQRRFSDFNKRNALNPEDSADYLPIQDQIALNLLELDRIHAYQHNPTLYVELAGNAIFLPLVYEYAPKEQRVAAIAARLRLLPALFQQARQNLLDTDPVYTKVAMEENDGNLNLVKTLAAQAPASVKANFQAASGPTIQAIESFNTFLKDDLAKKSTGTWRLGPENYRAKLRLSLETNMWPVEVLADAEAALHEERVEAYRVALLLHNDMFPSHGDHRDAMGKDRVNHVIKEVLDKIAEEHPQPSQLKADVMKQLDEIRAFVRQKDLISLSPHDNLQVIDTPEFMRGIYGVAGFQGAPPMEPELGAFYWVTPIPSDWPKDRIESKLREYNSYMLQLLTIHEAIPGHYIQFEHANAVIPMTRRLMRSVFGNSAYVEGWAVYITRAMVEEGYMAAPGEKVNPKLYLTMLKGELRAIANAILDVRMHTKNMTDQEAMDLMINDTFQERTEAEQKLQRAKLSSTQLPTYFVGLREWLRLRNDLRAKQGAPFSPKQFHDRALAEGPLPMPVLRRLLTSAP